MITSTLLTNIKNSLQDDNIYRTDAILLGLMNDGYKLTSALTLFDERRSSVDITGTRNWIALPTDSSAECLVPFHVSDSETGRRVNPAKLDQFEFYSTDWEGNVASDGSQYYVLLSPHVHYFSSMVVVPIANTGSAQFNVIGAFIPVDLTSTDEIRISDEFVNTLYHYTRFMAFIGEPGRADDGAIEYREFVELMNRLTVSLKSRFPSGRDYEPWPVEFIYEQVTQQDRTQPTPQKNKSEK